ncbi:11 TM domain-containing transmembrane protein [Acrasis kona]|uniref:11 TM domain-containing transmembrane protein n=1 Tax=Acrasis kona TaxID=1008807 RepID=A0AAW2ZEX3_9EUKA
MVGERNKEIALTLVTIGSAFLPSLIGVITGYISDQDGTLNGLKRRIGKRKPFMFIGVIIWVTSIMLRGWLYFADDINNTKNKLLFFLYAVVTTIGYIGYSIVSVPYNALMQDAFPKNSFGVVSGVSGFLSFVGSTLALTVMGYLYVHVPTIILCSIVSFIVLFTFLIVCLLVPDVAHVVVVKESQIKPSSRSQELVAVCRGMLNIFINWDFFWMFAARFILMFTIQGILIYFLYYMKDVVGPRYHFLFFDHLITSAPEAQAVFMLFVVLSSMVSSILGGVMSDRVGRKYVVCASAMTASLSLFVVILIGDNFSLLCMMGIPLGAALGSYNAADNALISEIVSVNREEACKKLGVYAVATDLSGVLASPVIGVMLFVGKTIEHKYSNFPVRNFGYVLTYGLCASVTFIASVMILFLNAGNTPKPKRYRMKKHKIIDEGHNNEKV